MKARLLKKLLNNTGYSVSNDSDKICIGSPLCHDLISVDKVTFQIRYALDTWRKGRESVAQRSNSKGENELLFIWDKLQELIDSGEINSIINDDDVLENPLPVFTVSRGVLIETFTDAYGWPNTTVDGTMMYDNTYFKTKEEAVKYGIEENNYFIEHLKRRDSEIRVSLEENTEEWEKQIRIGIDLKKHLNEPIH